VDIKEMICIYENKGERKSFPGYENTRNRRFK
jgi:hypothetical protein